MRRDLIISFLQRSVSVQRRILKDSILFSFVIYLDYKLIGVIRIQLHREQYVLYLIMFFLVWVTFSQESPFLIDFRFLLLRRVQKTSLLLLKLALIIQHYIRESLNYWVWRFRHAL